MLILSFYVLSTQVPTIVLTLSRRKAMLGNSCIIIVCYLTEKL